LELLRPQCRSVGDFESSRDHCAAQRKTWWRILTAVVLTLPQGISSLLQSQVSLHHNMACIIQVLLYIYIWLIWPQKVVEHNRRSTWIRPLRELRDALLGGRWGETMEREVRKPTINTPPHLLRHPNGIHGIGSWFEEHRNRVRRYDTTQR